MRDYLDFEKPEDIGHFHQRAQFSYDTLMWIYITDDFLYFGGKNGPSTKHQNNMKLITGESVGFCAMTLNSYKCRLEKHFC